MVIYVLGNTTYTVLRALSSCSAFVLPGGTHLCTVTALPAIRIDSASPFTSSELCTTISHYNITIWL